MMQRLVARVTILLRQLMSSCQKHHRLESLVPLLEHGRIHHLPKLFRRTFLRCHQDLRTPSHHQVLLLHQLSLLPVPLCLPSRRPREGDSSVVSGRNNTEPENDAGSEAALEICQGSNPFGERQWGHNFGQLVLERLAVITIEHRTRWRCSRVRNWPCSLIVPRSGCALSSRPCCAGMFV